jgi:hypothetical protein
MPVFDRNRVRRFSASLFFHLQQQQLLAACTVCVTSEAGRSVPVRHQEGHDGAEADTFLSGQKALPRMG